MIVKNFKEKKNNSCGVGYVAQLVEWLPNMHKALDSITSTEKKNLEVVVQVCEPDLWRWRQKDPKLKVILGCIASF